MGAHYMGSFIGNYKSKNEWLKDWTSKWEKNIRVINEIADKYPQKSYTAVVRAIQLIWIFLPCVMKDMRYTFTVVGKIIQETFLPCLSQLL